MRRLALWVAVVSLVVGAVCEAISLVVRRVFGAWTFYTPYSTTSSLSAQVVDVAVLVASIAVPIGLIAVSAYLVMAERELRRLGAGRGFEVGDVRQSGRDVT